MLQPGAGRGPEHAWQLRRGRVASHRGLRGRGHRGGRAVAREGPALRSAGQRGQGDRRGRRRRFVPDPAEAAHARVPARRGAPSSADQRHRRSDARSRLRRAFDSRLLPRPRVLLDQHADHHGVATPKAPASCFACRRSTSRTFRGIRKARSISRRISSATETFLTVSGQLERRGILPGLVEGLHVRADVSRRELEHEPPSRGVLDDRAGDCVRRSRRTTRRSPKRC